MLKGLNQRSLYQMALNQSNRRNPGQGQLMHGLLVRRLLKYLSPAREQPRLEQLLILSVSFA
jgi:hypothetical protein